MRPITRYRRGEVSPQNVLMYSYIDATQFMAFGASHGGVPCQYAANPSRSALAGYRCRGPAMKKFIDSVDNGARTSLSSVRPDVVIEPGARSLRSQRNRPAYST